MDFGFVPGHDPQDGRVRALFKRLVNTKLIQRNGLGNVRDFIRRLEDAPDSEVQRPIDNVLLGAHANSEGLLFLPMFPGQSNKGRTEFETLQETLEDPDKSIVIPDDLLGQTSDDPVTHFVHFKGCNIGKVEPFVRKLKEAFGGRVNVTAPKHFHALHDPMPGLGVFEWMAFEFKIQRPTKLPDRQSIIDAFAAENFTFLDGTPVSNEDLERWIPKRNLTRTTELGVTENLGTTIGRLSTITAKRQFRVETKEGFDWKVPFNTPDEVPTSFGEQMLAFQDDLTNNNNFSPDFPFFTRVGFERIEDFFAGYTWKFQKKRSQLIVTGSRVLYVIVVPIEVSIQGSDLVFNFHPDSGSSFDEIINLIESDDRFFLTV